MANHSGIIDNGELFQIIPSTRKIVVPQSHKIIGTVGSHNSEQLTFKCPALIDGHDIGKCDKHWVVWENANGKKDRDLLTNITSEGDYVYFKWIVSSAVTVRSGFVKFAIVFEDIMSGQTVYSWSTGTCNECQVLDTIAYDGETSGDVEVPEGYIRPSGTMDITNNGEYNVSAFKTANVNVFTPKLVGTTIKQNGKYAPPTGHAYDKVSVEVKPKIQEEITVTSNGRYGPEGDNDGLSYVNVDVQPNLQTKEVTENGEVEADETYQGLKKVIVAIPNPPLEDRKVKTKGSITVTPSSDRYYGLSSVTVEVDEPTAPIYEEQTVVPSEYTQNIYPSSGADALSRVVVKPIPDEYVVVDSGTKEITKNTTEPLDVKKYEFVEVNVQPKLQSKTVGKNQTVKPDNGYDGLSEVIVQVPSDKKPEEIGELENLKFLVNNDHVVLSPTDPGSVFSYVKIYKPDTLKPENIKKGVTIAGITGTFDGYDSIVYMYIGGSTKTNIAATDAQNFSYKFKPKVGTQWCTFKTTSTGYVYIVIPANKVLKSITMDGLEVTIGSDIIQLLSVRIDGQSYDVYRTATRQVADSYTYSITLE
jgi:hypothetical protein